METGSDFDQFKGQDTALLGLNIIYKHTSVGIEAAEHDVIYSASIEELAASTITEEEVFQLAKMNWHIDEDALAKFV